MVSKKEFNAYAYPEGKISKSASEVNNITEDYLKENNAKNLRQVANQFIRWVKSFKAEKVIIVSHLKDFDYPIFVNQLKHARVEIPDNWVFGCTFPEKKRK